MRILLTGGCGFVGHHVVDHLMKNTDAEIIILDRLSYSSSGFDRLRDSKLFDEKRIHTLAADFTNPLVDGIAKEIGQVDYILHLGAETHVDNSIGDPRPFVLSNVIGTMNMLEFARTQQSLQKFVYLSTDEVFGPILATDPPAKEWDHYNSSSPYAASKAGGEELCLAWANTFKVPVIIIHAMNIFGERQHPEKFIPKTIHKILTDDTVEIHADLNTGEIGVRSWIHARSVADAIEFAMSAGINRQKYNVVGELEFDNLRMAQVIAEFLKKPLNYKLVDYRVFRPGFDMRYALDGSKMASLGWKQKVDFESSLKKTIQWFMHNTRWLYFEAYTGNFKGRSEL